MMIFISSIVKSYKKVFGIDLLEYGLVDMMLEVELNGC